MEFCIVEADVIQNIIVCDSDSTAAVFGAVPSYDGAKIGDAYAPPPPPEPEPTLDERVTTLEGDTADLHEALDMILTGVTE